jgi:hypothetical protein
VIGGDGGGACVAVQCCMCRFAVAFQCDNGLVACIVDCCKTHAGAYL